MAPKKFTIRLYGDPRKIAIQALSSGIAERKMPSGTIPLLNRLREGDPRNTLEELEAREAAILVGALGEYAEAHLREGSISHEMAIGLGLALGDILATADAEMDRAARELEESAAPDPLPQAAAIHQVFTERTREQRDAILRTIFLGGPRKTVNIWGQVVDG